MNLIDDAKEDMLENDYLEMCNFMKKCYISNNKPVFNSFIQNPTQQRIMNLRNEISRLNRSLTNLKLPASNTYKRKYPVLIDLCAKNNLTSEIPSEHLNVYSPHKFNVEFLEKLLIDNGTDQKTLKKEYYNFRVNDMEKSKEYYQNKINTLQAELAQLESTN